MKELNLCAGEKIVLFLYDGAPACPAVIIRAEPDRDGGMECYGSYFNGNSMQAFRFTGGDENIRVIRDQDLLSAILDEQKERIDREIEECRNTARWLDRAKQALEKFTA